MLLRGEHVKCSKCGRNKIAVDIVFLPLSRPQIYIPSFEPQISKCPPLCQNANIVRTIDKCNCELMSAGKKREFPITYFHPVSAGRTRARHISGKRVHLHAQAHISVTLGRLSSKKSLSSGVTEHSLMALIFTSASAAPPNGRNPLSFI